ncbi:MAG: FIG00404313: hypothetical protein [uncultured Aureispira sp.]|uniref:GSCFA domain-containing protein n=1 Tax=uncultured Aureispira sp. TaxID=1331704 RepID=A0A6S6UJJ2_9BACT|nr:MAG: FIG00404313: hypothetical protein [uncultured Aureispira sp.]
MIKHKTTIELEPAAFSIKYEDHLMSMGSCFAQNIAQKLQDIFYNVSINPFGTLYNPISIRNSLGLLLNKYEFQEEDLFFHNGLWNSFQHHSSFSSTSIEDTLEQINIELIKARTRLKKSHTLLITLGTAWVHELRKDNKVVSNCHKLPANRFKRKRLSVQEIVDSLGPLFDYLKESNPALNIILTVSPIRHLKDGFTENQISKSTLLLATQELVQKARYIHYFPAYEIMMDDLRDYRYYADDLVHPSNLAVEYIWEAFSKCYLEEQEDALRKNIRKLQNAMQHRSFNPSSNGHQKFVQQQIKNIQKIKTKIPALNLEAAQNHFLNQLLK